jgi:hypothetical protein
MVASPTNTNREGKLLSEDIALLLPNTARFLEQLKHTKIMEKMERQRVPVPPSVSQNQTDLATAYDELPIIEGPRLRKMRKEKANKVSKDDDVPIPIKATQSLFSNYPPRIDDSESVLDRVNYRKMENGLLAQDSILNKVKIRRQQRANTKRLHELAEIDVDSFYSISEEEDDDDNDEEEEVLVDSSLYEATDGLPDVISDLSLLSARERDYRSRAARPRGMCGRITSILSLDNEEMEEIDRMTPKMGGCLEGFAFDDRRGTACDNVDAPNLSCRNLSAPKMSCGDLGFMEIDTEETRKDPTELSREREMVKPSEATKDSTPQVVEHIQVVQEGRDDSETTVAPTTTHVSKPAAIKTNAAIMYETVLSSDNSKRDEQKKQKEEKSANQLSPCADFVSLLLIDDEEMATIKKTMSCW